VIDTEDAHIAQAEAAKKEVRHCHWTEMLVRCLRIRTTTATRLGYALKSG
jgi:hypothetical protein